MRRRLAQALEAFDMLATATAEYHGKGGAGAAPAPGPASTAAAPALQPPGGSANPFQARRQVPGCPNACVLF